MKSHKGLLKKVIVQKQKMGADFEQRFVKEKMMCEKEAKQQEEKIEKMKIEDVKIMLLKSRQRSCKSPG
ncbi:hypothetical protein E2I00_016693 [Balaenoptera physalus]|uniref:Uncharacterized protein n=1 Tax=Balaenoptera physalus TaxID=9770 RepID=A0A6A1QAW4_BALPH|nr:hypothetical protein E2I00_016693 [Balaenoptera physalus]